MSHSEQEEYYEKETDIYVLHINRISRASFAKENIAKQIKQTVIDN
jgi:hypothetical protein